LSGLEAKGMVARTANGDRTVSVTPTRRAAENLEVLRDAWARELADALRNDLPAVRQCNELLARLETQLTRIGN
jgi:hypothetical protein